ncbi:MAG: glycosyltransferase family 4 protein [Verrucomicrobiia bacterium]
MRSHSPKTKRQRIVHLIHEDGPGGGPYTVVKHITYYSHFFDLHILHGGSGRIAAACDELGIPHSRLEIDRLASATASLPLLHGLLLSLQPHLVILHGQWAGLYGALAARAAGLRNILYIAQWPSFYTDWDLPRCVRNWLTEGITCRLSRRIICLSHSNRIEFLQRFPFVRDKVQCMPNSIDVGETVTARQIEDIRTEWGWDSRHCHLVSVGRLSDQKRLDWLLKAWAECRDLFGRARLWIVGDGPERSALEKLAEDLQLGTSCRFLGQQPRGAPFVAAADVVVFTSLYESFGNVALEAMNAGRPLIASDVPGIDATLENGVQGYRVPPGNIPALAEKMRLLVDNPTLREEFGKAGLQRVTAVSTPKVLPRYLDLVRAMTSK